MGQFDQILMRVKISVKLFYIKCFSIISLEVLFSSTCASQFAFGSIMFLVVGISLILK